MWNKVNDETVKNIIKMHKKGMNHADIGRILGLSPTCTGRIALIYDRLRDEQQLSSDNIRHVKYVEMVCRIYGFKNPLQAPEKKQKHPDVCQPQLHEAVAEQMSLNLDDKRDVADVKQEADEKQAADYSADFEEIKRILARHTEELSNIIKTIGSITGRCSSCGKSIPVGYKYCYDCNRIRRG